MKDDIQTSFPSPFFDQVLNRLKAVPFADLEVVAEATGISVSNLKKIRYGEVTNPGVRTVQHLHDYFELTDTSQPHRPADA